MNDQKEWESSHKPCLMKDLTFLSFLVYSDVGGNVNTQDVLRSGASRLQVRERGQKDDGAGLCESL